jgi:hypothetical protein
VQSHPICVTYQWACKEREGVTCCCQAPCTPHPVDVHLQVAWEIVVDYVRQAADVQASGSNIRGDQDLPMGHNQQAVLGVSQEGMHTHDSQLE